MTHHFRSGFGLPRDEPPRDGAADYTIRGVFEDLRTLFLVFWRGRYWIAAAVFLCAFPMFVYLMTTPSQYEATAQIMLDPQPRNLVEGAVVPTGMGDSSVGADTLLVDSQTEIMTSRAVLGPVVREHGLAEDPEFHKPNGLSLRVRLRNFLGAFVPGYEPETPPADDAEAIALHRLRSSQLEVERVGNTYLINVAVLSTDAGKAARLANAVANAYIDNQRDFLSATTREATRDLESRIDELRERVREAETEVEEFRREQGLLGGPGMLTTEQRLQDINSKLAAARAETGQAKARYERLREDTAENVAAGETSAALDNKVIVNLRALLAQADRRLAGLESELGPNHPSLQRARDEYDSIMRLIEQELARIRAVAKSEYELAKANEESLQQELALASGQLATNKNAQVRLRALEREAEAARAVLESFMKRARETREQETLTQPSSRIIAAAAVPQYSAYPPTKLFAAAAVLLGLCAGALFVWLRHVVSAPRPARFAAPYPVTVDENRLLARPEPHRGDDETPQTDGDVLSGDAVDAFQARLDALKRRSDRHPPRG